MSIIEQFGFTGTELTLINPVKKNTVKVPAKSKWKNMTEEERAALRKKAESAALDPKWNAHINAMVDRVLEYLPEGVCPPLILARDAACYV